MLTLAEPEHRMWERFLEGHLDSTTIGSDPLLRSWQRAAQLGVQAEGPAHPEGIGHHELLDRREREGRLVRACMRLLEPLNQELARREVLALLADAEGIVLHAEGGGRFLRTAARTRLVEGASWSERARGTNAIGTALVDALPIRVVGRAHFERINHALVCYAAPIRDAQGRVQAVLDFTGRLENDHAVVEQLLHAAVRAIEAALREPEPARVLRPSSLVPSPPLPAAFAALKGSDLAFARARERAARLAGSRLPVLLLGETGTGKELFARAVHDASPRRDGPFLAVNCGSLPQSLLATELFGHAPGAFTGASRNGQLGKVEAAQGGTLFLDEIAELDPSGQAALLRVLEDGSFHRVGDHRARSADFRLVCATCTNLQEAVSEGRFRKDLFFRLAGAPLVLPPLRERSDRLELATEMLAELTRTEALALPRLAASARAHLLEHDWPGNVRELKSALTYAVVMAAGAAEIEGEHFPEPFHAPSTPPAPSGEAKSRRHALDAALHEAMRAANGNRTEAARRLGVARSTLYRMLQRS